MSILNGIVNGNFDILGDLINSSNPSNNSPKLLNPLVWLRSDTGITTVSGKVSQWNDQSGNGYNVTQSNATYQPTYNTSGGINGRPRLQMNNTWLTNTSFTQAMSPVEIFIVATPTTTGSATNNLSIVDLGSSNDYVGQYVNSLGVTFYNTGRITSPAVMAQNVPCIINACNDGTANSFITVNNGMVTTGTASTTAQALATLTIGSYGGGNTGYSWIGDCYEVIVFNYRLTDAQRNQVINYLQTTYALTSLNNPLALSPKAWFSSDQGVTTISNNVSQWNDLSGNGYNLTQTIVGQRPTYNTSGGLNGKPRITFPLIDSAYGLWNGSFTLSSYPTETFVVAMPTYATPTYNSVVLDLGNQNCMIAQASGTNNIEIYNGSSDFVAMPGVNIPFIANGVNDGTTASFMMINGQNNSHGLSAGNVGTSAKAVTKLTVGNYNGAAVSGNGWQGDVYEVIVFNYILTSVQRNNVLNYLKTKYQYTTLAMPPMSIPYLQSWIRADQVNGLSNLSSVVNTYDMSTNYATFTGTSGHQFVWNAADSNFNNLPSFTSTTTSFMQSGTSLTLTTAYTLYTVSSATNVLSIEKILISNSTDQFEFGTWSGQYYLKNTTCAGGTVDTNPHLMCGVINGTAASLYLDNSTTPIATQTFTAVNPIGYLSLGYSASYGWNGTAVEYIVFQGAHTLAQRQTIFAYLANRYNKTWK